MVKYLRVSITQNHWHHRVRSPGCLQFFMKRAVLNFKSYSFPILGQHPLSVALLPLALALSRSLSLSPALSRSLSLSLAPSHSLSPARSLFLFLSLLLTLKLQVSQPQTQTPSLPLQPSDYHYLPYRPAADDETSNASAAGDFVVSRGGVILLSRSRKYRI